MCQCFLPVIFVNADGTEMKFNFFLDKTLYNSGNLKSKHIEKPILPQGSFVVIIFLPAL